MNLKKKIYIIGPVGSGKTTLAKKLSQKYNIKNYELDNIIWNDTTGQKRTNREIKKMFEEIVRKESYIIGDVGREIFKKGITDSDVIYYIKLNRMKLYFRILKRWIRQKLKLENSGYIPTIKILFKMFGWLEKDLKNQNDKIQKMKKINDNIVILNSKKIKNLIYERNTI